MVLIIEGRAEIGEGFARLHNVGGLAVDPAHGSGEVDRDVLGGPLAIELRILGDELHGGSVRLHEHRAADGAVKETQKVVAVPGRREGFHLLARTDLPHLAVGVMDAHGVGRRVGMVGAALAAALIAALVGIVVFSPIDIGVVIVIPAETADTENGRRTEHDYQQ